MDDHDNCNCLKCRARRGYQAGLQADADFAAARARMVALGIAPITDEAEANLWLNLSDRVSRAISTAAASMTTALDQYEAAKARCQ